MITCHLIQNFVTFVHEIIDEVLFICGPEAAVKDFVSDEWEFGDGHINADLVELLDLRICKDVFQQQI
jgi:hypothetical protein